MKKFSRLALIGAVALLLHGCATPPVAKTPPPPPQYLELVPASYAQLPGWRNDNQAQAFEALHRSCAKIVNFHYRDDDPRCNPAWIKSCRAILNQKKPISAAAMRSLIERYFTPYLATNSGNSDGLFTGYYAPMIPGSLVKTSYYSVPIYGKPSDLKIVRGTDGNKRYIWTNLPPGASPPTRAQLTQSPIPNTVILAWVHDVVDRYFLEIQGSGTIYINKHDHLLVGFAAQNGQPYYPIGKYLLSINAIPPKQMSMQRIRQWLNDHPDQVNTVLNQDPSFVFFRKIEAATPLGAEGVPLIPGRSIAIDPNFIPFGTPIWLNTFYPQQNQQGEISHGNPLQRLVVAQDKGGAIKGPVRADVFWGSSEKAVFYAGHMQSRGQYWMLLPKNLPVSEYFTVIPTASQRILAFLKYHKPSDPALI